MKDSKIEWTDHTFNPWSGCTKVSPGCANCYAESLAKRVNTLGGWGAGAPRRRTSAEYWRGPEKWNREAEQRLDAMRPGMSRVELPMARPRVFCASLADWLDDEVPRTWRYDLIDLIQRTPRLDWLLLTKRPQNWERLLKDSMNQASDRADDWIHDWLDGKAPANVWIGTTVEDQVRADERIPALLKIPARVRFLSCEPLLGPVDLSSHLERWEYCGSCGESFDFVEGREDVCPTCSTRGCMSTGRGNDLRVAFDNAGGHIEVPDHGGLHWVIVGGESGHKARPMHPAWARSLRDQCETASVAFFFKQWGEHAWVFSDDDEDEPMPAGSPPQPMRVGKAAAGRKLDGIEYSELPTDTAGERLAKMSRQMPEQVKQALASAYWRAKYAEGEGSR